jgi:hypothetical protein
MKNWYSVIYNSFIVASLLAFFSYILTSGSLSYGLLMSGFIMLSLAILMILIILFNASLEKNQSTDFLNVVFILLSLSGPFLAILGIIIFILYLIVYYKTKITENLVSNSYYTFTNITIILIIIQTLLVYKNIENIEIMKKIPLILNSLLYLLSTITLITSIIIYVILKYYTTDG